MAEDDKPDGPEDGPEDAAPNVSPETPPAAPDELQAHAAAPSEPIVEDAPTEVEASAHYDQALEPPPEPIDEPPDSEPDIFAAEAAPEPPASVGEPPASEAEVHAFKASEPTHEPDMHAFAAPEPPAEPEASRGLPPGYFAPEEPSAVTQDAFATPSEDTTDTHARWRDKLREWGGNARLFGGEVLHRASRVRGPRNVREAAVWSGWTITGFAVLIIGFFFFVTWDLPSTDDLWTARNGQSITFVDRNNHVILREGAQNAPPVDLSTLPPYVPQAFIAIEDRRFYQHYGVDLSGLMRAGAENLRAGHVVQGGSTITQQLAKNLFLTNERSWRRKAQEVCLAIWLETKFTKDEILALYLSRVYFGAGAYGIEAASERYFDRPARELTLLQAAMLAGLVKEPSRLNPALQDIGRARARAEVVLAGMVDEGFISAAERQAALREELVVSRRNPAGVLSYFRDWIDPTLNEVIGTQRDAFVVETTLDILAQRAGSDAINAVLSEQGQSRHVSQGALVAMDDTGGVRTMIGGRDYEISQFNRATQAHRQPGSSFKYFIYLAAMEHGLNPWTIREDAPISEGDWSPENYTHEYHGPVTLTYAFATSLNSVAIRVSNEVGGQNVIDVAERLGVRSPLHDYRSLALGAQEVTLLELTRAYGAMASEGYRIEPHGITRIRRANSGEVVWTWRAPEQSAQVIDGHTLRFMNYMMNRVVEGGTGTAARIEGRQIAGKTGTGNDYRDAWFIGFTPGMVAGVWVGNDNFAETNRVVGGSLPTDIWHRYMMIALHATPVRPLQMPTPEDMQSITPVDPNAITAVGAPIGVAAQQPATPAPATPERHDHSLDLGPEG